MEYYHGIFIKNDKQIEVEFPDLPGCVTFGDTWEEAYDNAVDVLAGWLVNAEKQFVKTPSSYEILRKDKIGDIVPIPIDKKIMESYETSKRFNVIFPSGTLKRVDEYRKTHGLKRSTLLLRACLKNSCPTAKASSWCGFSRNFCQICEIFSSNFQKTSLTLKLFRYGNNFKTGSKGSRRIF